MIRRGNHFIKLPGEYWNGEPVGWVLIDGPWFDRLTRLGKGYHTVRLPQAFSWSECAIYNPSPIIAMPEEIEWEQISWHPGTSIHPNTLNNQWLAYRWTWVLAKRKRQGWRISPDGQLPAYLNHIQPIDDPWQGEQMYQMGY
jgi:hypothetical protein